MKRETAVTPPEGGRDPPELLQSDPTRRLRWKGKRAVEWGFSLVLLGLLAPMLLLIAGAIRAESPGGPLFVQPRYGKGGRTFHVYKFRSMRVDVCDPTGGMQTGHQDPRVTRVGLFLRKTSLDELPQLLNVVRGEMALIGPRAHPCGMRVEGVLCEDIVPDYHARHRVPPGVTGWAQVNGSRGPVDTAWQLAERQRLDLFYIHNWSLRRDVQIFCRTFGVCLRGEGAR